MSDSVFLVQNLLSRITNRKTLPHQLSGTSLYQQKERERERERD